MKIFIIGIAGKIGSRLAQRLIARGDKVDGLFRRAEQNETLAAIGVRATQGDLATLSENALAEVISGADVLVFAAGAGGKGGPEATTTIDGVGLTKSIAAASRAGVRRFVLVSVFPDAWRDRRMPESFEHYMAVKRRAEAELAEAPLDWVILRPAALTDKPGTGHVSLSLALIHTEISRDDVAETLAEITQQFGMSRKILELTSGGTSIPEAVSSVAKV